jgi:hypothetical protein
MMFEMRRGCRAGGEQRGETRAEIEFEMRRGPLFELRGGLWPSRGETRVDPAGEQRGETRAEC